MARLSLHDVQVEQECLCPTEELTTADNRIPVIQTADRVFAIGTLAYKSDNFSTNVSRAIKRPRQRINATISPLKA